MKHLELRRRLLLEDDEELEHSGGGYLDRTDRPSISQIEAEILKEDPEPVAYLTVAMTAFAMVSYTMDVATSAVLCYWLYDVRRWWWWMTISPLVVSLIIVNTFSMRWYIHDAQEDREHLLQASPGHWVMRGLFHIILLGPVIRYIELFLYGLHTCDEKDPNRHQYRLMFLQEDKDVSLLTLVGSFVKSAPQLVLQMYILTQKWIDIDEPTTKTQAVSLVASLVELSLAQSAYHRALRRSSPLKHNMTKIGTAVQFFSHCCVIASRVLALAAFATAYGFWIFVFCGIHWILMTSWLIFLKTSFCATSSGQPRPLEELFFNVVVGVIYVFCFVNVKDEPTRWKYSTYYSIILIENVILTILWYLRADTGLWFRIPLLTSVVLSIVVGLTSLVLYYQYLHPNKIWKKQKNPDVD